jgi:hypothetical protein
LNRVEGVGGVIHTKGTRDHFGQFIEYPMPLAQENCRRIS